MNQRKAGPLYGIGGVTLLTVLLVLCLTLFAVLALSTAQADLRLSEKNARAVSAYYEAESQAFALIRQSGEIWPAGSGRPAPADFLAAFSSEVEAAWAELEGEGLLVSAEIPMQDGQLLQLAFHLKPGGQAERWEIRQWQLLPPAQDEGDIAYLPLHQP